MKICVFGLWHLGTVTAACLADAGHQVIGLDSNLQTIEDLNKGIPPLFEPGLEELVNKGLASQNLHFTNDSSEALDQFAPQVLWVTFDTPVDDNDVANVDFVINQVSQLFSKLQTNSVVLISSQVPVGSTRGMEQELSKAYPDRRVYFAYSPENLRLGKAIQVFTQPDRIIVGYREEYARKIIQEMLKPITDQIEWMSTESAEMTKHALNAFLALSVVYINEISSICEATGADAKEVERGLKTESRIGPKAYLSPGGAFAGGTLARDVNFLSTLGIQKSVPLHLIPSIKSGNDEHKLWASRRLKSLFTDLNGKRIAVWGLTYKPGTNTLRRSSAIELCQWLSEHGAIINAHDPEVRQLPNDYANIINLCNSPLETLLNADALVVATEWPIYREVIPSLKDTNSSVPPVVIDANRFIYKSLENIPGIKYYSVGKGVIL